MAWYTPKVETTTKQTNKNEEKDTSKDKKTETELESDKDKETGAKDTQTQVKVEPEKVTVAIYVDNNEYDTGSTKRDDTAYTRTISATGTITVKIVIKDSAGNTLVTKTKKSINLNETNSIIFE